MFCPSLSKGGATLGHVLTSSRDVRRQTAVAFRPAAFITSPLLPKAVVGTTHRGIFHETDWHTTFAMLAGLSAPAGVNGLNAWLVRQIGARAFSLSLSLNFDLAVA